MTCYLGDFLLILRNKIGIIYYLIRLIPINLCSRSFVILQYEKQKNIFIIII